MENMATTGSGSTESKFRTLRALFITGYVLNIILWFVPSERFSHIGGESTWSRFDLWFGNFSLPGDLDLLLVFASNFVFIALALALPRRWVFITASSVAALFIVVNLITTYLGVYVDHMYVDHILVPRVLQRVASQLTLLGFFIKPPAPPSYSLWCRRPLRYAQYYVGLGDGKSDAAATSVVSSKGIELH